MSQRDVREWTLASGHSSLPSDVEARYEALRARYDALNALYSGQQAKIQSMVAELQDCGLAIQRG